MLEISYNANVTKFVYFWFFIESKNKIVTYSIGNQVEIDVNSLKMMVFPVDFISKLLNTMNVSWSLNDFEHDVIILKNGKVKIFECKLWWIPRMGRKYS